MKNVEKETAQQEAERIEKYWNEVEEKTNSVLEVLKGVSYVQLKAIQRSLDEKIKERVNSLIAF